MERQRIMLIQNMFRMKVALKIARWRRFKTVRVLRVQRNWRGYIVRATRAAIVGAIHGDMYTAATMCARLIRGALGRKVGRKKLEYKQLVEWMATSFGWITPTDVDELRCFFLDRAIDAKRFCLRRGVHDTYPSHPPL